MAPSLMELLSMTPATTEGSGVHEAIREGVGVGRAEEGGGEVREQKARGEAARRGGGRQAGARPPEGEDGQQSAGRVLGGCWQRGQALCAHEFKTLVQTQSAGC